MGEQSVFGTFMRKSTRTLLGWETYRPELQASGLEVAEDGNRLPAGYKEKADGYELASTISEVRNH